MGSPKQSKSSREKPSSSIDRSGETICLVSTAALKLRFLLDLQAREGGSIRFDRWMQEALYHPEFGYYAAGIRDIGRRGDFTTWPIRHNSLARALAAWALANRPAKSWHLIEVGAGTGILAAGILRAIGWWHRPKLHIVEVSAPLRVEQQKRLGRRAIWHARMEDALTACRGQALIYSNELVDAFPARIFRLKDAAWQELALRIVHGQVEEVWRNPTPDAPLPESKAFATAWPEGQRIEVQDSYRQWQGEWDRHWKAGAMLTVDYGDTCPALYHRRPPGTLRAFAHHQRLEGPAAYAGFGLRDLTVDVNFSDLMAWSRQPAAQVRTLEEFLGQHLAPQEARSPDGFPEAAEAFKVLEEFRG